MKIKIENENRGFRNNPNLANWMTFPINSKYSAADCSISFSKIHNAADLLMSEKIVCLVSEQAIKNLIHDGMALRRYDLVTNSPLVSKHNNELIFHAGSKQVFVEASKLINNNEALLFGFNSNDIPLNSCEIESPNFQLTVNTDFSELNIMPLEVCKIIDIVNCA